MTRRIMIMAGGTGGHIFPGIALANALTPLGWQVLWLGTKQRMEAQLVPKAGYKIAFIDVAGVRGNGLLRLLMAPFRIAKSILQAIQVLRQFKPDLVVGMGGFASGPGGVAAKLLGIPLVIHEQNAVAGLTNRLLAYISSKVLMGFDNAFPNAQVNDKYVFVGNPVRPEFCFTEAKMSSQPGPVNVLVVGGSLGARALNQHLPKSFSQCPEQTLVIRHQCGKHDIESVTQHYTELGIKDVDVTPFITDMASAFRWADIVICRAGALTVAEIAAVGVAAIFIPLPYAVDDHQTKNAEIITRTGGGIVVSQASLAADGLTQYLVPLIEHPERLREMAANTALAARHDALQSVVQTCLAVVEESL